MNDHCILVREFRPRVCCWHMWVAEPGAHQERCAHCGAACTRDGAGRITDYSAPAGGEL